jgi:flagellar biosynthetic protein FliQ
LREVTVNEAVELGRRTIEIAIVVGAPILAIAVIVSLLINVVQVLTSLQDPTISAVPRLAVTAVATILLMPWMWRKLMAFTVGLFSDFRPWLR